MSVRKLIPVSTGEDFSDPISLPVDVRSPAPDESVVTRPAPDGGEGVVVNRYDGSQLAPRRFAIALVVDHAFGALPANARAEVQVKNSDGEWDPVIEITAFSPLLPIDLPLDPFRIRKLPSSIPFGVDLHGWPSETANQGT